MKNKKKGFTLVELIVVLAILAILAAMLVPALTGYIDKANEKKVMATARQYYIAAQTVVSDAYSKNDKIATIVVAANGNGQATVTMTSSASTDPAGSLADEFEKLAEIKSGDAVNFIVDSNTQKVTGSVTTANRTAEIDANGNWSVHS